MSQGPSSTTAIHGSLRSIPASGELAYIYMTIADELETQIQLGYIRHSPIIAHVTFNSPNLPYISDCTIDSYIFWSSRFPATIPFIITSHRDYQKKIIAPTCKPTLLNLRMGLSLSHDCDFIDLVYLDSQPIRICRSAHEYASHTCIISL